VLGELANSSERVSWQPSDTELVAHGNVLFMSGSEPIAVSLAWILLMLSQRPDLCLAVRQELGAAFGGEEIPHAVSEAELPCCTGSCWKHIGSCLPTPSWSD
jgi:cytochrome P450